MLSWSGFEYVWFLNTFNISSERLSQSSFEKVIFTPFLSWEIYSPLISVEFGHNGSLIPLKPAFANPFKTSLIAA